MAKHSKINPIPYLLAVFFTANVWGMLFYIGNPPNIIVAQAFNLSFIEYAKLMLLPTIAAGISTTFLTYFVFRKDFSGKVELHDHVNPEKYLKNKGAAIISVFTFAIFFVFLFLSEEIGLTVWAIVLIFFIIYLLMNLFFSIYNKKTKQSKNITDFLTSFKKVPWKMLPLIVSLFVLIHLFTVYKITDILTHFLNNLNNIFLGSIVMSFISAISSNIMINQPTTILFANALQSPLYTVGGTAGLTNGLALVIGTNLGGNLTLFGALAGLMWVKILSFNGIKMNYKEFLIQSLKITPFVILITSLVLLLQMLFLF